MSKSYLGFRTLHCFSRLKQEEADELLDNLHAYESTTGKIKVYQIYEGDLRHWAVKYTNGNLGISWVLRFCNFSDRYRVFMVETIIDPRQICPDGDISLAAIAEKFNVEAGRISKLNKFNNISSYKLKGIVYFFTYQLDELGVSSLPVLHEPITSFEPSGSSELSGSPETSKTYKTSGSPKATESTETPELSELPSTLDASELSVHMEALKLLLKRSNFRLIPEINGGCGCGLRYTNKSVDVSCAFDPKQNSVRFEVRCNYQKLYQISRNVLGYLLSDCVCRYVVGKYWSRVIMPGDYYSYQEALNLINYSGYKRKTVGKLIETIELIDGFEGIRDTWCYVNEGGGNYGKFYNKLRKLSSLGINPVLIPDGFSIKHIPNPLQAHFDSHDLGDFSKVALPDWTPHELRGWANIEDVAQLESRRGFPQ